MLHTTAAPAQPKYVQCGGAHLNPAWFCAASGAVAVRTVVAMNVNLQTSSRGRFAASGRSRVTLCTSLVALYGHFSSSDAQQLSHSGRHCSPKALQGLLHTSLMAWCTRGGARGPPLAAAALRSLPLRPACSGPRRARCAATSAPAAQPPCLRTPCACRHSAYLLLEEGAAPPRRSCKQGTT